MKLILSPALRPFNDGCATKATYSKLSEIDYHTAHWRNRTENRCRVKCSTLQQNDRALMYGILRSHMDDINLSQTMLVVISEAC